MLRLDGSLRLLAAAGVLSLPAGVVDAAPITPASYTYGSNAESQPQPTSFQNGWISDVGNLKLNDDVISSGGWSDDTHVGFKNDSDNGNPQPRVTFDLGATYAVSTVAIYTNTDFLGSDESVSISSSTDGVTFGPTVDVDPMTYASGFTNGKLRVATIDVSSLDSGQFIRIDVFDTGQWMMISEIDFDGALVPEPSSLALLGLGGLAVVRRRRG